jgi:hypothetical protein
MFQVIDFNSLSGLVESEPLAAQNKAFVSKEFKNLTKLSCFHTSESFGMIIVSLLNLTRTKFFKRSKFSL